MSTPDREEKPTTAQAAAVTLETCREETKSWRSRVADIEKRLATARKSVSDTRTQRKSFALSASAGVASAKAEFSDLTEKGRALDTEVDQLSDALEEAQAWLTKSTEAEREAEAGRRLASAREAGARVCSLGAEIDIALRKVAALNWERAGLYDDMAESGALNGMVRDQAQQLAVLGKAIASALHAHVSEHVGADDSRRMACRDTVRRLMGGMDPIFAKSMAESDRELLEAIEPPSVKAKSVSQERGPTARPLVPVKKKA